MIDIKEEFEVAVSPELVWNVISNPYEVVGCVPGASITGQKEDGTYEGSIDIKFGPTSITFQMLVTLDLNSETREGKLTSQAKDKRGGTRTKATATFNVTPAQGGAASKISMQSSVDISGPLAGMVETGATFVVKRMVDVFAQRLAEKCGPPKQQAPQQVSGSKTGWWQRVLSWFRAK